MLLLFFTLLVGNGAGGLASRQTGSLAFTAAALNSTFLQVGLIQSLNMFHRDFLHHSLM